METENIELERLYFSDEPNVEAKELVENDLPEISSLEKIDYYLGDTCIFIWSQVSSTIACEW